MLVGSSRPFPVLLVGLESSSLGVFELFHHIGRGAGKRYNGMGHALLPLIGALTMHKHPSFDPGHILGGSSRALGIPKQAGMMP